MSRKMMIPERLPAGTKCPHCDAVLTAPIPRIVRKDPTVYLGVCDECGGPACISRDSTLSVPTVASMSGFVNYESQKRRATEILEKLWG